MTARLHFVVDGPPDRPVLVLGSSLGTTGAMWGPQLPALTQHFRVVRYDHRGHGNSPVSPGPYRLESLAEDVLALLDRLELDRVHYAGLSLGGMVGMELAARAPERIGRLALLCTSAQLGPPEGWHDRARIARTQGTAALVDVVVGRWFTPDFAATHPATVAAFRAMVSRTPSAGYAGCCEAIAAMDLRARLASIQAPTLVVAGSVDPATPPEHGRLIAESVPSAHLAVIDGAAHLANVERPEPVAELMVRHLTGADE